MTRAKTTAVVPGQSWAIRDDRYDGWRYVRIESIDHTHARVAPRSRNGRRSHIRLAAFGRSRFTLCGHDGPGLLPAYTGSLRNCPDRLSVLPLDTVLAVGFGAAEVSRDGETVWTGDDDEVRLAEFDTRAQRWPGDWRLRFDRPLSEELYQRQPDGWVLVWRGFGFA